MLYPPPSHRSPVTLEVDALADPKPAPEPDGPPRPLLRLERGQLRRRPRRLDQGPVVYRSGRLRSRSRSGGGSQRPILETECRPGYLLPEPQATSGSPGAGNTGVSVNSRPDLQRLLGLDFGFMLARSQTTQTAAVTFVSLVLLMVVLLPLIDRLVG